MAQLLESEMIDRGSVRMNYAEIQYNHEVEATQAKSEQQGPNTFVHHAATPGSPEYFDASSYIAATVSNNGTEAANGFYWKTTVHGLSKDASHAEILDIARRQTIAEIRELADALEEGFGDKDGEVPPG